MENRKLGEESKIYLRLVNPVHTYMDISINTNNDDSYKTSIVTINKQQSISTFLAPKDHSDDDDNDATYKSLKEQDNIDLIHERRLNYLILKLNLIPNIATQVQVSIIYIYIY